MAKFVTLKPNQLAAHLEAAANYQVDKNGDISPKNDPERRLYHRIGRMQLRTVDLSHKRQRVRCYVHVLVALYHVKDGLGLTQSVIHLDGDYANNSADNLAWFDPSEDKACTCCGRPLRIDGVSIIEERARALQADSLTLSTDVNP